MQDGNRHGCQSWADFIMLRSRVERPSPSSLAYACRVLFLSQPRGRSCLLWACGARIAPSSPTTAPSRPVPLFLHSAFYDTLAPSQPKHSVKAKTPD